MSPNPEYERGFNEAIEAAAKWHDDQAAVFMREHDRCMERHQVDKFGGHRSNAVLAEMVADRHREYAKAIRALKRTQEQEVVM